MSETNADTRSGCLGVTGLLIFGWVGWQVLKPVVPHRAAPVSPTAAVQSAAPERDKEWREARLQVEAFCWRVREDENVNLRVEDFDAQGGRAEMIRFAHTLEEVRDRGDMDEFVKFMADKNRAAKGPAK